MASRVFTELLGEFHHPAAGATVSLGPVPTGFVWVVRDITMYNDDLAPSKAIKGLVWYDPALVVLYAVPTRECWTQQLYHWEGRQVMNPGDTLTCFVGDLLWDLRITGYQLTLP